jgi:hypothetical protein
MAEKNENEKEKMNIVDSASLTFFTNPLYFNILQRKKLCQIKDNAEEVKFYRKRIIALFKELLKESSVNREIKELHTMFVSASIRYFEIMDKKDIVQGQHQHQHQHQHIQDENASMNADELDLSPEDLLDTIGGTELTTMDEANDLMMRKTITVANLDNYVIASQDNSANEKRIIPLKMEIDLKTHDLKTKGVPPKKLKIKKEDLSN